MAYMDQATKTKLSPGIKAAMPKGWKYTLSIRHHSTLILTITSAPVDLLRCVAATEFYDPETATHCSVSRYHLADKFSHPDMAAVFTGIYRAMMAGNHDRSDIMTDYYDVGWYAEIHIGRDDKPFTNTAKP